MIIIFSRQSDESSIQVYEWLNRYSVPYIIIYPESDIKVNSITIDTTHTDFDIEIDGEEIKYSDISGIWYRRGYLPFYLPGGDSLRDKFICQEYERVREFLLFLLEKIPCINKIEHGRINKLEVLHLAALCGLDIPLTYISGKKSLIETKFRNAPIINKAICENSIVNDGNEYILPVHQVALDELSEEDGLSLFQTNINKQFEIRIFHFWGENYSMAIFSQMNEQTKQDFRFYNLEKPNRWSPYTLPAEVETKVNSLMKMAGHNSGSIDLIYSEDNRFIFLEINPIGQYDMISETCNYDLHKVIANKLQEFYYQKCQSNGTIFS